jgi:hypothetical protein
MWYPIPLGIQLLPSVVDGDPFEQTLSSSRRSARLA